MAPANAFPKQANATLNQTQALKMLKHSPQPRASFSRASDFVLTLIPVVTGVSYAFYKSFGDLQNPVLKGIFSGAMSGVLAQDQSVWFQFLVAGLFVLGLGSAVGLMRLLERLEEWDEKHFPLKQKD